MANVTIFDSGNEGGVPLGQALRRLGLRQLLHVLCVGREHDVGGAVCEINRGLGYV